MLGSILLLYCILTLFGSFLLYRDVEDPGCDPCQGVLNNASCENTGPDVFGAMLGVAFVVQGMSQFGNVGEAFTQAHLAAYKALKAINRKTGAEEEIIYHDLDDDLGSTTHSKNRKTAYNSPKTN